MGRREIEAELFVPDGQGPWPGVLVLHEMYGLNSNVRADARDLARNGFIALAPDLYSYHGARYCLRMFFSPAALAGRGDIEQVGEIHRCLDYLKELPQCNGKLGMIGMCLTGGFVLHMARRSDMEAPVVFHHSFGVRGGGMPAKDAAEVKHVVQGHFGSEDRIVCPKARVDALARDLGDRLEVNVYRGIGHGIRSTFRHTVEAGRAWAKTLDFLHRNLYTTASSGSSR
ncbi:MAG: dienelactone hydrolase family protein [Proteobacteria bacterium]|nr:dienelactone hydrolase family protein [Pseudomonadota bacterium]